MMNSINIEVPVQVIANKTLTFTSIRDMNGAINMHAQAAAESTDKPAWYWRNILRWRAMFAKTRGIDVDAFLRASY